jgi:hypothetical protein
MNQWRTHPLKWSDLIESVERSGMKNPDVWIEDLRRYGACSINGEEVKAETWCKHDETDCLEASFSTAVDIKNNRIIIRHHY